MPGLSHSSLRRVLQSLITTTISCQHARAPRRLIATSAWADDLLFHEAGQDALGCDSLEMLQVSSAVNEMFHLYEAGFETRLLQAPSFGAWLSIIEDAWKNGVEHITVSTSGSTGRPKFCSHAFRALEREAAFFADLFRSRRRIVLYTPAHHIYGVLFGGFLPDDLGIPVIDLQGAGASLHGAGASLHGLGSVRGPLEEGDLVVSFPEGWSWIERNIRTMPANVEGVTSTAPCPRTLVEALVPGKLSRLVEVYGSSETAGIGTRVWPEARYRLMPHLEFIAAGPGQPCELQLRSGQRVELMDDLQRFDDDTFLVTGRKDLGVQVGGVNVFPSLIERRLQERPGVAEVSVRLMRPDEGRRLKCFIVPCAGQGIVDVEHRLLDEIALWPIAAERPMAMRFGSALPRNSAGKVADW